MKRKLTILLALSLCLGLVVPTAHADGDFWIDNGYLIEYTGSGGDVVIPSGVVAIMPNAFRKTKATLTSVTIPSGVTDIGAEAFKNCTSLTSVTIPDSVTSIMKSTFKGCTSLTSVTIPGSVTSIGELAFFECTSLTDVTIQEGVTSIGRQAFQGCTSLTGVTIPNSVTTIGRSAFLDCTSLTSVTIPNSVTTIEVFAFFGCTSLTDVTIPDSVTSIEQSVFSGCTSLTDVTIPDSVTSIGGSFQGCGLTSVTIPASVSSIDRQAFSVPGIKQTTTVFGSEGSYAQLWAMENGYTFEATLPSSTTPGRTAYNSTQSVLVDRVPVEFQCYALKDEQGNPTNYVKLRDVAFVLNGTSVQFSVGWDGEVTITTGTPYTPNGSEMSTPYSGDQTYSRANNNDYISINGNKKPMASLLLKDADGNGYTYFKLRDLGAALGFKVDWIAEKGIFIETK